MRKTYDAYPYWEDEENKTEVCFRFIDRLEKLNCREVVLQAWVDFDNFCYEQAKWLYDTFKINLLSDRFDRPWFTGVPNGSGALQQKNYEKHIIDNDLWAHIKEVLDRNEWERW